MLQKQKYMLIYKKCKKWYGLPSGVEVIGEENKKNSPLNLYLLMRQV